MLRALRPAGSPSVPASIARMMWRSPSLTGPPATRRFVAASMNSLVVPSRVREADVAERESRPWRPPVRTSACASVARSFSCRSRPFTYAWRASSDDVVIGILPVVCADSSGALAESANRRARGPSRRDVAHRNTS